MKKVLKLAMATMLALCVVVSASVSAFADRPKKTYYEVKFYLLNEGLAVPAGTASQPKSNYSYVGEGFLTSTRSFYSEEGVQNVIAQAPQVKGLKEGQSVLWYVVKTEADGVHVDGVVIPFYSVLYDGNNATSGSTTDSKHYYKKDTITIKDNAFVKDGYKFVGWNTEKDGSGKSYKAGATFAASSLPFNKSINLMTLYAQWEEIPKETTTEATTTVKPSESTTATGKSIKVSVVTPKKMSIRLEDGTVLKTGDSFDYVIGAEVKFQMCSNNWDNDTYDDNGNGIAGTVVYTFRVSNSYTERSYDPESHSFVAPKGDPVLRTDTNKCFMAYRFYNKKGDYNKQTGIKQVVNTPLESLSVNLPLGSTITADGYKAMNFVLSDNVFIETNDDKTICYKDYYWNY